MGDTKQSWIEAVITGMFAAGVNRPTLTLLNVTLVALLGALSWLLYVVSRDGGWMVLHVSFLLFLTVGLIFLINWFVSEMGLVSAEKQAQELAAEGPSVEGEGPVPSEGVVDSSLSQETKKEI